MTRLQAAVVALAVLAVPVLAHAGPSRPVGEVSIALSPESLATAQGRESARARIAALADAYCRANPVGHTVAACRAEVASQLSEGLEAQAQAYARAHPGFELAGR